MRIEIFGKNYNPSDSLKAITAKGVTYRASAQGESPFDNIDEVIPRLLGQVRKQKDIWEKDKKGGVTETPDDEE